MQRSIFAASAIFPITFFCAGLREFFEGIADRARGRMAMMKKLGPAGAWPSPELEHARGESLLGGRAQWCLAGARWAVCGFTTMRISAIVLPLKGCATTGRAGPLE
jgi:hypothetical protein